MDETQIKQIIERQAPQRNRFFDKAGKKQPEDTGEIGRAHV